MICEYIVTNQWNTGFTANIRLTNNSEIPVNDWEVSWLYADGSTRTHGWCTAMTGENPYTATALSWNRQILPGKSVEFGMVGAEDTEDKEKYKKHNVYLSLPIPHTTAH